MTIFCGSGVLMFVLAGIGAFLDSFPSKDFMSGVIRPYLRVTIPLAFFWAVPWSYSFVMLKKLSTLAAQLLVGGGFFIQAYISAIVLFSLLLQSINVWFDKSQGEIYRTNVNDKIAQVGHKKGYTIILISDPRAKPLLFSLQIHKKTFNALEVEDEIQVTTRAGRLGVEWIEKVESAEKLPFSG